MTQHSFTGQKEIAMLGKKDFSSSVSGSDKNLPLWLLPQFTMMPHEESRRTATRTGVTDEVLGISEYGFFVFV